MTSISSEFLDLQAALAGQYSLERELGRGGMGIVYLARDVELDRDVAIKVLPAQLARQPASRERFIREARTAAGLSHPHVVPIHRVGESGGFVYIVMSYVAGETLGERLRRQGPLSPAEATRVLREVAWALAYAHGRGIVHRDVKPDNILLEAGTGRALVTDFGIARGGSDAPSTDPGRIMGTAHYMSPEQAANEMLDGRSDIYALGVVGYLAVSGRLPFQAPSLPALLLRQATEEAPSVSAAAPGLPPALAHAIDRCLERDPSRRHPDGEALAAALAPPADTRPALSPTMRAWLAARNPATPAYSLWSGLCAMVVITKAVAFGLHQGAADVPGIANATALGLAPLVPMIGFHVNQARRLFRTGHSLTDLRHALAQSALEQSEGEALASVDQEGRTQRAVRVLTYGSTAASASVVYAVIHGMLRDTPYGGVIVFTSFVTTILLAALSNALEVSLMPNFLRLRFQSGLRERLWKSRVGEWIAHRLDAPTHSRAIGAGAFRATEVALGIAAADLWAALPGEQRQQLAALPQTVIALEARAAEARATVDALDRLGVDGAPATNVIARREQARTQLASTVAALEGIRLDLLRLHAGASDLAPLTTLLDAARLLGDDVNRLADARRDAESILTRLPAARAVPTPA